MAIRFFLHHINYRITGKKELKTCIRSIINDHKREIREINIIITSDLKLLEINKKYLSRNYFTDIITFDLSENEEISGDMYISIERVKENAILYKIESERELFRVIIHGILHLIGYNDKSNNDKRKMTNKENRYIDRFYKQSSDNQ